ncbi:hypothetical protein roselon_01668 [Roseibacterium elongatum DSM 19469]|uniref:Uncharacterized protein n=1 Tax=Roseicyclus elongatus DSM 19469 TaxID=1294273 RepID=W8SNE6_9RHOB|nr:hypothetical protein [Roseibacterium elongatum]AHM04045.1 hypothetical protein roselon_01668 [Roseibacterium elongatum DSM 19469]
MWKLALALVTLPLAAAAQTCTLDFTVTITQGVGPFPPGAEVQGHATYTAEGRSFRQEGGATAHMVEGEMVLDGLSHGDVWTLITTSRAQAADLVGLYVARAEGFSFAGVEFDGPMQLTLFGEPGARATNDPPSTQADFDLMNLRRAFTLHSHRSGRDMLSGEVTRLIAQCS